MMDRFQQIRILEAIVFASAEPVEESVLAKRLPEGADIGALLHDLQNAYANRGVHLQRIGKGWGFRTAADLAPHLREESVVSRKLSRAAIETLAIIAYHQPITRAEIEEMRGVALSRGTLDSLLEAGWIRPRGRRRSPGRPVTWGTTEAFLDHFGLEGIDALPGMDELKAAGLLDRRPGFGPLSSLPEQAPTQEEPEDQFDATEEDEGGAIAETFADVEESEEIEESDDATALEEPPSAQVVTLKSDGGRAGPGGPTHGGPGSG